MSTSNNPKLDLRLSNLGALSSRVRVPSYNPKTLTRRIVHIGVGAFNRAHQAIYLDDLLHRADGESWGECGIGLLPGERRQPRFNRLHPIPVRIVGVGDHWQAVGLAEGL